MFGPSRLPRLALLGAVGLLACSAGLQAQLPLDELPIGVFPPVSQGVQIDLPGTTASSTEKGDRVLLSGQAEAYSHGDPTPEEQYILELINRARANPTAEGEWLASINDPAINSAYTFFNIDRDKLRTQFAAYPQRPPLAFNSMLIASARRHSNDMNANNFQGHTGSDGSSMSKRIVEAGYVGGNGFAENVSAYSQTLLYGHVGLNVDWGEQNQIDLGHRRNIMNFDNRLYTEIGVGIVFNGKQIPHVGPYIITENFGNKSKPFLLGVVYHDKNNNDFYDVGEGLPGVTITPSSGQYYAVTSASGGYAIPAPTSGSWTVTASGGALPETMTATATFSGSNVKLDFLPNLPTTPGRVVLTLPANVARLTTNNPQFSWEPTEGAIRYHFQLSTSPVFAGTLVDDSTWEGTTFGITDMVNAPAYYWRVRAGNDVGWGAFSDQRVFSIAVLPAMPVLFTPGNDTSLQGARVNFHWSQLHFDEERYWFELSTDPQMNTLILKDTIVLENKRVVTDLANGTTYYWRVKTFNGVGWGPFSSIWSFSTSTSGVTGETANSVFRLSANTPNPFSGSTLINFELARPEQVTLSISNSLGEEVAVLASGRMGEGEHQVRWDASGMEDGVYYYRLRAGNITETRSMILVR